MNRGARVERQAQDDQDEEDQREHGGPVAHGAPAQDSADTSTPEHRSVCVVATGHARFYAKARSVNPLSASASVANSASDNVKGLPRTADSIATPVPADGNAGQVNTSQDNYTATLAVVISDHGPFSPRVLTQRSM
jgi:hypothetical protein